MFQFIADSVSTLTSAVVDDNDVMSRSSNIPPPNLQAKLVSFTKSANQEYHEFEIEVSFGYNTWSIRRRYKQFHELHVNHITAILTNPVNIKAAVYMQNATIPELPPKKMCGNREEVFVSNRKVHLENYLNEVLKNVILKRSRPFREFLTDANRERINRFYNVHVPLLHGGARFKKIGAVFQRVIRFRLTDDNMALEYWTPVDGLYGKGDDVRTLRIHTIRNVSPTNDGTMGIMIIAERECVLDCGTTRGSKTLRDNWLFALKELVSLMHLIRPDDDEIRQQKRDKKANTFRDTTNNRLKQKRAMKRKSIADKYAR